MRAKSIGVFCLYLALLFVPHRAIAQVSNPGLQQSGIVVPGNCVKWGPDTGRVSDAGDVCALASGVVKSWNSRVGDVVPIANDYDFNQLSGALACTQTPALSGDITTVAGNCLTTLTTVNANVGSFGSATACVAITANAKGLITAISAVTCTPAFGSITGSLALTQVAPIGANTLLGALTATTPSALAVPSCAGSSDALQWTSGAGFSCRALPSGGTVTSAQIVAGAGMGVFTGTCTITTSGACTIVGSAAQLPGIATNTPASAGNLGEFINNTVEFASRTAHTSAAASNQAQISLTAGEWVITGMQCWLTTGTTNLTWYNGSISTASATTQTSVFQFSEVAPNAVTGAVQQCLPMGPVRALLSSTTTYYLVRNAVFSVSTLEGYGGIQAWRVR